MDKSPDAFRTISEVAEMLGTPAHVLRFWESRFPQIRPVKRAGGRRYYRPADVMLLTGIKTLLHDQGMTIRGVQKILREQGVRQVAALSGGELPEMRAEDSAVDLEQALAESFGMDLAEVEIEVEVEPESATIIALETALRQPARTALIEEPDLPAALSATGDQAVELPPETTDLFDLLADEPGVADPSIGAPVNSEPPDPGPAIPEPALAGRETEALVVDTPNVPDIAPQTANQATNVQPLDLARRLRRVKATNFGTKSAKLAELQARLTALHTTLGSVQPAPIAPLP